MATEQNVPLNLGDLGLQLGVPPDVIGPSRYVVFQNMESFRDGAIQSRMGSKERAINLGSVPNQLPTAAHSYGYLLQDVDAASYFEYLGVGTDLYAVASTDVLINSSDIKFASDHIRFSGSPMTVDSYRINEALLPHSIIFDKNKRVKMDGLTAEHFGIPGPTYKAAAATNGAGNLTGVYDWRYQYRVEKTQSVSPLSPVMFGTKATGTLTSDATAPSNGDAVTIDTVVYTARTTLSTGPTIAFEVLIGGSAAAYLDNLKSAINLTGTIGTDYSTGTTIHTTVTATTNTNTTQVVEARISGTAGNVIPTTETSSHLSWGGALLAGAVDGLTTSSNAVSVTVRQPNDIQISHIDLYRRGGTLTDGWYFVKSAPATAFAGTQVIADNLGDVSLGDVVADNQIEFSNVLHPATVTKKTVNDGAAYTDYTSESADSSDVTHVVLSALDTVANGDWMLLGADLPFRKIGIGMDSTSGVVNPASVNANASVLAVHYWNGTAWTAVSRLMDGTSVGGVTFAQNGVLTYDFPGDWALSTIDTVEAYYVRVSVSAALSASVLLDGIRVSAMEFDADTFAIHADRLWANDLNNPDRVWFSQRFRVEEFRDTNFLIVPQGGDRVRRIISLDDQAFVFSDNTVYRIVGIGQELIGGGSDFQAIATGAEHGLYAKYAVTKGNSQIFYRSYDGIYVFAGSGIKKISDPDIDILFRSLAAGSHATTLAVYNTFNALSGERMSYFNGKIYWSYQRSDSTRQEFVYDNFVNRWYMTDFQPTAYLPIDYQGRMFFADQDKYLYLRETGNSDIATENNPITMKFLTGYFDFDTPQQDKNFVEPFLDADLGGASVEVQLKFDNGDFSSTFNLSGTGRQRYALPVNGGLGAFAKNVALSVESGNSNLRVRFYKITCNFWTEPRELNKTSWDWNDYGNPDRKYFKQLILDLDTQGTGANVSVFLDGSTTAAATFANVVTTNRQRVVLSMPTDTQGKLAKVLVESLQSSFQVKAYGHYFNHIVNGIEVGKDQTEWSDLGWMGDKRLRQLMLEVDTLGLDSQVNVEVDNAVVETFTANCNGRNILTHSLPLNTVGKLARLTFNR